MHFQSFAAVAIAACTLLADAAPFVPQNGRLQQQRRRLVDYPVQSAVSARANGAALRKRAVPSYSVVQVDGSSQTTNPGPAETVVVTASAVEVTQTLVYTTTTSLPSTPTAEVVVVTNIGTPSQSSSTPDVETVFRTVTATPSATSTSMYDDGLWHTYYPVKDWWNTPATSTATAVPTPAAAPSWVRRAAVQKRRVPSGVKLANWDLTRTEEAGIFRFRK